MTTARGAARALIALAALALLAALPALAGARMTPPQNSYIVKGGKAPVLGMAISHWGSKQVLVSVGTNAGELSIAATAGVTPAFGYDAGGGSMAGAELLFYGHQPAVNRALAKLEIRGTGTAKKRGALPKNAVITGMAIEYQPGLTYFPKTEHFYKFVAGSVAWKDDGATKGADSLARASKVLGVSGYLATITSKAENDFVASKLEGADGTVAKNVWFGANDSTTEGKWVWSAGPQQGDQFYRGIDGDGGVVGGRYNNWAEGEPNNCTWVPTAGGVPGHCDSSIPHAEDCGVINRYTRVGQALDGTWNDLDCTYHGGGAFGIGGYVVEYGDKAVGGSFSDVDTVSQRLVGYLPPTKVTPNLRKGIFPVKGSKPLMLESNGATFKVKMTATFNVAGRYVIYLKRPDGKGVPFEFQPGSTLSTGLFKTTRLTKREWSITFTTTKANQKVTVTPILKTNDWAKPNGTKLFFSLIAPAKAISQHQMCLANWCQSAKIPVPSRG